MSDIESVKAVIEDYRKQFPRNHRYPKVIWQQILPLAQKYKINPLAQKLDICSNTLRRRLKQNEDKPSSDSINKSFIELPAIESKAKAITLYLPYNIQLKIEL